MKSLVLKCFAVALLVASGSSALGDDIVYDNDYRAGETSLIVGGSSSSSYPVETTCSACETCGWY
jgi:hypothetical protein